MSCTNLDFDKKIGRLSRVKVMPHTTSVSEDEDVFFSADNIHCLRVVGCMPLQFLIKCLVTLACTVHTGL